MMNPIIATGIQAKPIIYEFNRYFGFVFTDQLCYFNLSFYKLTSCPTLSYE